MKLLKFDGELYHACAPRRVNGKYTCDAWKQKTGRVVNNFRVLNNLGEMLIRGKGNDKARA